MSGCLEDQLALKPEQQDQRREQRTERQAASSRIVSSKVPATAEALAFAQLCNNTGTTM